MRRNSPSVPTQCTGGAVFCNANYGPPCYGCWGPGESENANGQLVPVSQLANETYYAYDSTTDANGGTTLTYIGSFQAQAGNFQAGLASYASATFGTLTNFQVYLGGAVSYFTYANPAGDVGEGDATATPDPTATGYRLIASGGADFSNVGNLYTVYYVAERSNAASFSGHVFLGFRDPSGHLSALGFYPAQSSPNPNTVRGPGTVKDNTTLLKAALSGDSDFAVRAFAVDEDAFDAAEKRHAVLQRYRVRFVQPQLHLRCLGNAERHGHNAGSVLRTRDNAGQSLRRDQERNALMRIFVIALVSLLACGAIAASPFEREEYVQTDCSIIDNDSTQSASISVETPSGIKEGHKFRYDIDFQPGGPVVRLPPEFYAPPWTDIKSITMEYPSRDADSGTLSLKLNGLAGEYTQPVGKVQRACWKTIRSYIERKFPDHSPIVERVADR